MGRWRRGVCWIKRPNSLRIAGKRGSLLTKLGVLRIMRE